MQTRLNVGCGTDVRAGWVNLDVAPLAGVDVVHDINRIPYPFADETFDEILCQDILEHMTDLPTVLFELKRLLKSGGKLRIQVPHFSSRNNFADPTHKRMFSLLTFEYFVTNAYDGRDYYFAEHFDRIESARITFTRHWLYFWNYAMEPLVNLRHFTQNYFEMTGWCRLFPAENLKITLIK
ncbi:MAG TPA: methyltransferase domain-containing protein [Kiritimatiellia bacterium]|nr:methyltransferase domain-containing protein [Kiritimatiellia bacterium]